MPFDQILCISYFDQVIGPNIFYSNEQILDDPEHPDIKKILEFNEEEGTFMFAFRKYQTINYLFYIDSQLSRGGKELVMISYMIRSAFFKDEIQDIFKYLDSKASTLEEYALELKSFDELVLIMHEHKDIKVQNDLLSIATLEFKKKFMETFQKYFKKLSPQSLLELPSRTTQNLKKIFIFGPSKSGKLTFVKNIEVMQFLNRKSNDISTKVYEIMIDNMETLKFDKSKKEFACEEENFENCLKNAQAFICIFNATNKESIDQCKEMFQIINNKRFQVSQEFFPILLIGNNFYNKKTLSSKYIQKYFGLDELKRLGIKVRYFQINVLKEDEKVTGALRWLVKNLV